MKWFVLQSFGLALLAFGLGALFHRLLWRKTVSSAAAFASSPTDGDGVRMQALRNDLTVRDQRIHELQDQLEADRTAHEATLAEATADHERKVAALEWDHTTTLASTRDELDQVRQRLGDDGTGASARLTGLVSDHAGLANTLTDGAIGAGTGVVPGAVAGAVAGAGSAVPHLSSPVDLDGPDVAPDDLARVDGVGPRIAEILRDGGVRTFSRLASMPEDRLRTMVTEGGINFAPSLGSWPAQAALLRDGDEAGFQTFVAQLLGEQQS